MAFPDPGRTTNLNQYDGDVMPWSAVIDALNASYPDPPPSTVDRFTVLGTVLPNGRPHAASVGVMWIDGRWYVGQGLNNLAGVLQDQGDLAGARERYERALAIREAMLPPPSIVQSLGNLAAMMRQTGDPLASARFRKRILTILQQEPMGYAEGVPSTHSCNLP